MLFDLNDAWSRIAATDYDVCICGTGPAGITTARKLADRGKRVLLLEGGDLSYTDASQDLYNGKTVGRKYWYVETGRLRYFGGTSNHWSGRCGLLDPIDFEARPYFGLPGWPISRPDVFATLDESLEILDIAGKSLAPYTDGQFESSAFMQSGFALSPPTRFAEKYDAELRASALIDVFYNANLIDVRLRDGLDQVEALVLQNLTKTKVKVTAKTYVLALGAIETARVLLNANSQIALGVGNTNGWVGKCFMEHLNVPIGRFIVTDPVFWKKDLALVPTTDFMQKNNIGNGIVAFGPNATPVSYGRLRVIKQFLRETGCALPSIADVARRAVDFDCPGDGLVTSLIEQTPNPASRVSLTNDVDAFGMRRIQVDWEFTDNDNRTVRTLAVKSAQELARLNLARVQLAPFITNETLPIDIGGHCHQMGTVRMASSPRYGVVNEDCQVHGIDNLYLAGSSVFPTGGGTNPTLTLVMLALRLGEHLGHQLQR